MRKLLGLLLLLACFAVPALAQWANTALGGPWLGISQAECYNGSNSAASCSTAGGGSTTQNTAWGTTLPIGAVVVEYQAWGNGTASCSAPTGAGVTTWTALHAVVRYNSTQTSACAYYGITTSSGTAAGVCNISTAETYLGCDFAAFTGGKASPLDKNCATAANQTTSGTGANNETCSATMTPAVNGELILIDQSSNSGTVTTGTGYTFVDSGVVDWAWQVVSSTSAVTAQFSNNTSAVPYVVMGFTFEPQTGFPVVF